MSDDRTIGVESTPQTKKSKEIVENSRTVGVESKAREDLYVAKAIEDSGLAVDIVGITKEDRFQALSYGNKGSRSTVQFFDQLEKAIEIRNPSKNRHFGISYSPRFQIYYKTPLKETYMVEIEVQLNTRGKPCMSPENRAFIKEIWKSTVASDHHDSVSDISKRNPIECKINPGDGFGNGRLIIGDCSIDFSEGEEVEVSKTDADIGDAINYCMMDQLTKVETDFGDDSTDWYSSYVCDIHESEKGDTVYIEVPRPTGESSLFPLDVSYDSSDPLWDVLDKAGGDIMDIRGMDVYVRNRGATGTRYSKFASNYDYKYTSIENIECQEGRHIVLVNDEDAPVKPVTCDVDFMWELGIGRMNDDDKDGEESENSTIVDSVFNLFN